MDFRATEFLKQTPIGCEVLLFWACNLENNRIKFNCGEIIGCKKNY